MKAFPALLESAGSIPALEGAAGDAPDGLIPVRATTREAWVDGRDPWVERFLPHPRALTLAYGVASIVWQGLRDFDLRPASGRVLGPGPVPGDRADPVVGVSGFVGGAPVPGALSDRVVPGVPVGVGWLAPLAVPRVSRNRVSDTRRDIQVWGA